jgi:hypothetical protein
MTESLARSIEVVLGALTDTGHGRVHRSFPADDDDLRVFGRPETGLHQGQPLGDVVRRGQGEVQENEMKALGLQEIRCFGCGVAGCDPVGFLPQERFQDPAQRGVVFDYENAGLVLFQLRVFLRTLHSLGLLERLGTL